jgi:hypothetical protein
MRFAPFKLMRAFKRADAVFALAALAALGIIAAARPGPSLGPALAHAGPTKTSAPKAFVSTAGPPLQCVPYARERSGVALFGDARTWWTQAQGRYRRSHAPAEGTVIVLGGTEAGHVGVVARILNARQILIDHANWQGRGEIIFGALVEDASPANDWSAVRVWNVQARALGRRAYPVFGFVLADGV